MSLTVTGLVCAVVFFLGGGGGGGGGGVLVKNVTVTVGGDNTSTCQKEYTTAHVASPAWSASERATVIRRPRLGRVWFWVRNASNGMMNDLPLPLALGRGGRSSFLRRRLARRAALRERRSRGSRL